jgi:hypothetical protein
MNVTPLFLRLLISLIVSLCVLLFGSLGANIYIAMQLKAYMENLNIILKDKKELSRILIETKSIISKVHSSKEPLS